MLDPLTRVEHVEHLDPEIAPVFGEIVDLPLRVRILHGAAAIRGRRVDMIDDAECRFRPPDITPRIPQAGEGLGAGVFVQDGAIDIEQQLRPGAVPVVQRPYLVPVDDFVVEGSRLHFESSPSFGAEA